MFIVVNQLLIGLDKILLNCLRSHLILVPGNLATSRYDCIYNIIGIYLLIEGLGCIRTIEMWIHELNSTVFVVLGFRVGIQQLHVVKLTLDHFIVVLLLVALGVQPFLCWLKVLPITMSTLIMLWHIIAFIGRIYNHSVCLILFL